MTQRLASKLLPRALSAEAGRQADESTMFLDNALVVFQQLIDLGSATFNIPELPAAGKIGIEIVAICNVRQSFIQAKLTD